MSKKPSNFKKKLPNVQRKMNFNKLRYLYQAKKIKNITRNTVKNKVMIKII